MSVNTTQAIGDFEDLLDEQSVSDSERDSLVDDLRGVIRRYEEIEQEAGELVRDVAGGGEPVTVGSLGANSDAVREWASENPETTAEIEELKADLNRLLRPAGLSLDEDFNLLGGPGPDETFGETLGELCSGIALPYVVVDYAS
ncbi:hypothetical protein [Halobellus sp. GM3]|uniref:hypothetical protein n=1 Tax=Halobellus sp. GM3 TaxID=3458410 RepID=UPI00403D9965